MKSLHVIYVVDDGIASLRCGVGVVAMHLIASIPAISRRFRQLGVELRFSVVSLAPVPRSVGIRNDLLKRTKRVCSSLDGTLSLLPLEKNSEYFNFASWKKYNRRVSKRISALIRSTDEHTIVIANDTIFSHLHVREKGVTFVWIPHSLALVHRQAYVNMKTRIAWEREALVHLSQQPNAYIGSLSPFVQQLLIRSFAVSKNKILSFPNGFRLPELRNIGQRSPAQVERYLRKRGVPIRKPLVVSYARADEYKGLETSLRAMIALTKDGRFHGVLIASRFSNESIVDQVQERLRRLLQGHESRVTVFFGYEFDLPKYLIQYPYSKALLHLPTRDFCPLIPFEAEILGHSKLSVINSNLPCFSGLLQNGHDAFLVSVSPKGAIKEITKILQLPESSKQRIIRNGRRRARRFWNIENNYFVAIKSIWQKTIKNDERA